MLFSAPDHSHLHVHPPFSSSVSFFPPAFPFFHYNALVVLCVYVFWVDFQVVYASKLILFPRLRPPFFSLRSMLSSQCVGNDRGKPSYGCLFYRLSPCFHTTTLKPPAPPFFEFFVVVACLLILCFCCDWSVAFPFTGISLMVHGGVKPLYFQVFQPRPVPEIWRCVCYHEFGFPSHELWAEVNESSPPIHMIPCTSCLKEGLLLVNLRCLGTILLLLSFLAQNNVLLVPSVGSAHPPQIVWPPGWQDFSGKSQCLFRGLVCPGDSGRRLRSGSGLSFVALFTHLCL